MAPETTVSSSSQHALGARKRASGDSSTAPQDALAAGTQAWEAYAEGYAALQQEAARFVKDRMEHDLDTLRALAGCPDLGSAAQVQWDWLRGMSQMYADEMTRMSTLAARVGLPKWPQAQ